jgi:hypothetical protein
LSDPDAERRDAARGAGASHLVDQRRGQAGAAATKRVTDRNRAAVDVQSCVIDAQLALAGEGLRGERLVQLEEVDAGSRHDGLDDVGGKIVGANRRQCARVPTDRCSESRDGSPLPLHQI